MNSNKAFELTSNYKLSGDQPQAVSKLTKLIQNGCRDQVLLGVTGSGKTFSMANIIQKTQKSALIIAPNKTLAAQLFSEMKEFFPENAVEYFVSYYDYYQPEAYIPKNDVYIEKDASINEQIDRMRHSATQSLLERKDVIIVASVSCIYGLGSPELYSSMKIKIKKGDSITRNRLIEELVKLQYERNEIDFRRGKFRARGGTIDIFPSHYDARAWRIEIFDDNIEKISEIDSLANKVVNNLKEITVYANSHYITPKPTLKNAIENIKIELKDRLEYFYKHNKFVEAQRLQQRTEFDIEMMLESGMCKGIENYSRYLSGRNPGDPPPTLFEYLPKDALLFIDESHMTVPQINGMYNGDRARKQTLIEYGFRLPSALDNRPLKFDEWDDMRPQTIFVSATPGKHELTLSKDNYAEQIIRPTGLTDPVCEIRPAENQVDNLIAEVKKTISSGYRVLVTTLTKKMAEKLTEFLLEINIKVSYLHSDVKTLERIEIIQDLRKGDIDVIVGINLLREGLDIPECALIAILDADKEGFLRSESSLIQTIGRVARNVNGKAILYADNITNSISNALSETDRRRRLQLAYNKENNISPKSIEKSIQNTLYNSCSKESNLVPLEEDSIECVDTKTLEKQIKKLRKEMLDYASKLDFEKAAKTRDIINQMEKKLLDLM